MATKRTIKKQNNEVSQNTSSVYEETGCQQLPPAAVDVSINVAYGQIK